MELEWMEPPARGTTKYAPILEELKKKPGEWASVAKDAKSQSLATTLRKHGCEVQSVRTEEGKAVGRNLTDIFARWVPKAQPRPATVPAATAPAKPARPTAAAIAQGTALTPPARPAVGGAYSIAARRARGVPEDGTRTGLAAAE